MKRIEYRPPTAIAFAITTWVLTLGVLGAELYVQFNPAAILIALAVCYGAFLIFIRPKVVVDGEGIEIINPLVRYEIGWQQVEAVDARFSFFVQVNGKKIHAFAAVASGRYANLKPGGLRPFGGFFGHRVEGSEIKDTGVNVEDGSIRAVESPRSDTGAALAMARHYLERFEGSGKQGNVRVDYFSVVLLSAILLTATVLI